MLLVKKLITRPPSVAHLLSLASPSYAPPPGKSFYVTDKQTKTNFLGDTSTCRSIHQASPFEKRHPKDISIRLAAANGNTITTYRAKTVHLAFTGYRFSWKFVLANVKVPLLGADFLVRYQLLVDVTRGC